MVDRLSPERRSALMARIGPKNTKPDMIVRRPLHAAGGRYRLHRKSLPGTPNLVFETRRAATFVHGCFWHGRTRRMGRLPGTRTEFWLKKVEGNKARDARKVTGLVELGWRAMTVWQCSLKHPETVLDDIEAFLRGGETTTETKKPREGGKVDG